MDIHSYQSCLFLPVFSCPWQVMSYEALKDVTEYGRQKWIPNSNWHVNSSLEGLLLGGLAGGMFLPCASI